MHVPGSRLRMRGVSGTRDGERTEVTILVEAQVAPERSGSNDEMMLLEDALVGGIQDDVGRKLGLGPQPLTARMVEDNG